MPEMGTRSDSSKVILGCPRSGPEVVQNYDIDSAIVEPGYAGSLNSDGEFVAGGTVHLGISRGQSMAHEDKTSVTVKGEKVPLRLTDDAAVAASLVVGDITFTAKTAGASGNDISIALVGGGTAGAETLDVDGSDIVVNIESGVSTATQIKNAVDGDEAAAALVSVEIAGGEGSSAQSAAAADNLEGGADAYDYVQNGTAVYVHDTTGRAAPSSGSSTVSNWKYSDGQVLDGIVPSDGSSVKCALVDM